jgi:hypothetical protein
MEMTGKDLRQQIERLITVLQQAEAEAKQVLQTARAGRRSFGLSYNYLDEDVAHLIGRVRYMQLMARRWEEPPAAPSHQPPPERSSNLQENHEAHEAYEACDLPDSTRCARRDDHWRPTDPH